jgi:hypothetical protein
LSNTGRKIASPENDLLKTAFGVKKKEGVKLILLHDYSHLNCYEVNISVPGQKKTTLLMEYKKSEYKNVFLLS